MSASNGSDLNEQTFWQAVLDIERLSRNKRRKIFCIDKRSNNDKSKNNKSKDD